MRLSQFIDRSPQVRRKPAKAARARTPVAIHRAFVPMVGLWGAALLGLSVMVSPAFLIERANALSHGAIGGESARMILAGIATLLGGTLATLVASAVRSAAFKKHIDVPLVSAVHARRLQPIDPSSELGSDSLDAPIEDMPFISVDADGDADGEEDIFDLDALLPDSEPEHVGRNEARREPTLGELSRRGYEDDVPDADARPAKREMAFTHKQYQSALIESCEGATCEASPAPAGEEVPAKVSASVSPLVQKRRPRTPEPDASAPRAMDLGEFAQLPGRNAVWVEGDAGAPEVQPQPQTVRTLPPASALEKLRRTPPEQLSLVEMVERFAAALHEHQNSERARRPDNGPRRDAALAEALKALTLFTQAGFDTAQPVAPVDQLGETERELRNALAKLQTLRGAA